MLGEMKLPGFPLPPVAIDKIAEMPQLTQLVVSVADEDIPKLAPLRKLTILENLTLCRQNDDDLTCTIHSSLFTNNGL